MRTILSGDGGGIRGIIQVCELIELERQMGKPVRECVDMLVGTSTFALQAAALAAGVPAVDLLPLYTEAAPNEIFRTDAFTMAQYITHGFKFQSDDIAKVMRRALGPAAGWTLNDCPLRILLTGVHVSHKPLYFVQDTARNAKTTGRLSLLDCCVASAAAPTYFTPRYVSPLPAGEQGPIWPGSELVGKVFDGGTGVLANPVYRGCKEAFDYDDFDPKDTRVVSLGTGTYDNPHSEVNEPVGLLPMVSWVISTLFSTIADEQTAMVEDMYPGIMRRINCKLPRAIDEADMTAIPELLAVGKAAAAAMDWKAILGE